ncbi:MAG: hypothetical protein RLZZ324_367 [Candidatus Parcubacteria bacterium]|jgi:hypothetical protein
MPRLTEEQVFDAVSSERNYAKRYDVQPSQSPDHVGDADKPIEVWLLWMEQYLTEARAAATSGYDKDMALRLLRRVLSLGVNCAMYHGLPPRTPGATNARDRT